MLTLDGFAKADETGHLTALTPRVGDAHSDHRSRTMIALALRLLGGNLALAAAYERFLRGGVQLGHPVPFLAQTDRSQGRRQIFQSRLLRGVFRLNQAPFKVCELDRVG